MVTKIWSAMDRIFCHSRPFFAFVPPNNSKNQNFEKIKKKKTTGDMDRFLPFYPLTTQKINILQKMKKILEILSFYTSIS